MIDIYVCEDVREQRQMIVDYIARSILIQECDMQLKVSTDVPEFLLKKVRESKNMGLYFLDIDLKAEMDGLELAEEIRNQDPRGFIVFITTYSEMATSTFQYKVEALDFIIKDEISNLQQRIYDCIEYVSKKYQNIKRGSRKTFSIVRAGRKFTLEYRDILFFETSINEHKLIIHTYNKTMEFFGKIKEIEEEMGETFIRCHRSYLVNRENIREVRSKERIIVMKDGSECPVSYRLLGKVRRQVNGTN